MFFPRSSYYDTIHQMASLPIICNDATDNDNRNDDTVEDFHGYVDEAGHCSSSVYFYADEEHNLTSFDDTTAASGSKTLSHTPMFTGNTSFQPNFDSHFDESFDEPFYSSRQMYHHSTQFDRQQSSLQHHNSNQQQQYFHQQPPPPLQMGFMDTFKSEIPTDSFNRYCGSKYDENEEVDEEVEEKKESGEIRGNDIEEEEEEDEKINEGKENNINKINYKKVVANFPPIVSALPIQPSTSSPSPQQSLSSSSNILTAIKPINNNVINNINKIPTLSSSASLSPLQQYQQRHQQAGTFLQSIPSRVSVGMSVTTTATATTAFGNRLFTQMRERNINNNNHNINDNHNINNHNLNNQNINDNYNITENINTIISMAISLRDRNPLEYKRLLKMLNSLSQDNKVKTRKKQKRPPFFISTSHPFPESDKDKYCVKESSDDGSEGPFTLDGSNNYNNYNNGNNGTVVNNNGCEPPTLKKAKLSDSKCGNGKKSSSAKKFNLPKIFSECEYYKCSFCNEKKIENSFRNHIHNNEKFRINWYCPICEKEYAVTYRGAHLKEKHGVSKDPKASEMVLVGQSAALASPTIRPPVMNSVVTPPTLTPPLSQQQQQQQQQQQKCTP